MKISTMYSIMLMLINNDTATRKEISERYEMSPRTVQRYINELMLSGVPVQITRGQQGGYSISNDYKLPYALFSKEDAERIRTCLGALALNFKDRLSEELIDKITAYTDKGEHSFGFAPALFIDYSAWSGSNASAFSAKLNAIDAAIKSRAAVEIDYTDRTGQSSVRIFDPYSLVLKESVWYVYGWCRTREEFRLFRLARIKSISLTDSIFKKRAGSNLRAALSVSLGENIDIELELSDDALAKIEEWLGAEAVSQSDGKYKAKASLSGTGDLVRKILSFGGGVKVLKPASLAKDVRTAAEKIAHMHS